MAKLTAITLKRGNSTDFKHPAGFLMPVVDINRCEGKGPCVEVCPVNVFRMELLPRTSRVNMTLIGILKGYGHGWKQALVIKPDVCRACGLCVTACPEKAIKLARYVG